MKKNTFLKTRSRFFATIIAIILIFATGLGVYAEEYEGSDNTSTAEESNNPSEIGIKEESEGEVSSEASDKETTDSGVSENGENIFEDIYSVLELNADKIFSILAFIGTIVVSVGYKSGLLPLLRDALSKLKGSIDLVKEDGERNNQLTSDKINEISQSIDEINESLKKNSEELSRIEWQFEGYDDLCRERESMKTLIEGQIDMLYAIFMSSALPQYQKDEIGAKIGEMREELKSYGVKEN